MNFVQGIQVHEMYRGQARAEWTLTANLVRKISDPLIAKQIEREMVMEFDSTLKQEGVSLHVRKQFLNAKFHSEWLMIQQAQHFRLPTRFMDWTISPEVALLFAVENRDHDDTDAHFWIYIVPHDLFVSDGNLANSQHLDEDPFECNRTFFLNSSSFMDEESEYKIAERRRFRQNGRFCIQPYQSLMIPLEEQDLHKRNLIMITIPAAAKVGIRLALLAGGYSMEGLYVEENPVINEIVQKLRTKYNV